ncbi:unnamed protein product [Mytilus coruscus]|uniref:ALOG domain-containing protein n=1 Tax=Mytilus coruscus TaxID=42192 RepID=A0A6J8BSS4_MYTCO|nr:unnamed protein product [Mytilus coruscus]
MVIPDEDVRPIWCPLLSNSLVDHIVLGRRGELGVLLVPSKKGFVPDKRGLKCDLWAARNIRQIDYESCKICGCLNHKDFRFCQFCGDRGEDSGEVSIDDQDLKSYNAKKRILYLENMLNNKTYDKKKVSLKKDLESFLIGRAKNLTSATPEDIRLFLIDRDMKGKTKIHDLCCPFLGDKKFKDCSCPCRLASGTVSSLASQLKAIFDSFGRKGEWTESGLIKFGNPVSSTIVKRYLEAVKLEQAVAHVPIVQAKPMFLDKLKKISVYITEQLNDHMLKPGKRFVYLRDRAFFTLQFFAGDRASDLGKCLAQEVKKLTDSEALLFRHTVGKTLGNGKINEFVISPVSDKLICPVENLNQYVSGAEEMDIDLSLAPQGEEELLARRLASPCEKNPSNAQRLEPPLGSLSIQCMDMPLSSDSPPWVCTPPRVPSPKVGVAGQTKLVVDTSLDVTSIIETKQKVQEYNTETILGINSTEPNNRIYNTESNTTIYNTESNTRIYNTESILEINTEECNTESKQEINNELMQEMQTEPIQEVKTKPKSLYRSQEIKDTNISILQTDQSDGEIESKIRLTLEFDEPSKTKKAKLESVCSSSFKMLPSHVHLNIASGSKQSNNIKPVKVNGSSKNKINFIGDKVDIRNIKHSSDSSNYRKIRPRKLIQGKTENEETDLNLVNQEETRNQVRNLENTDSVNHPFMMQGSFHQGDDRFRNNSGKQMCSKFINSHSL